MKRNIQWKTLNYNFFVLHFYCIDFFQGGKLIVRPANVANVSFGISSSSDRNVSFA